MQCPAKCAKRHNVTETHKPQPHEIEIPAARQVWAVRPPVGDHILLGIDTGDQPTLVFAADLAAMRGLRDDIDEILGAAPRKAARRVSRQPRRTGRPA